MKTGKFTSGSGGGGKASSNPSGESQKKAGNYPMGHLRFQGMNIIIENPKGSVREGVNPKTGEPWKVHMPEHYGYITGFGRSDADGNYPDVYLANVKRKRTGVYVVPDEASSKAYIVDQQDPDTNEFDEHKIILGANSQKEAVSIYHAGFSDGTGPWRMQAITEVPVDELKRWLEEGDTGVPFCEQWEKYYVGEHKGW